MAVRAHGKASPWAPWPFCPARLPRLLGGWRPPGTGTPSTSKGSFVFGQMGAGGCPPVEPGEGSAAWPCGGGGFLRKGGQREKEGLLITYVRVVFKSATF